MYRIKVSLKKVLALNSKDWLRGVGLSDSQFRGDDHSPCQRIGAAVAWLEHDGLLIPSARSAGTNLVIFPTERDPDAEFEILDREQL
jgi:RES domain-containing protein